MRTTRFLKVVWFTLELKSKCGATVIGTNRGRNGLKSKAGTEDTNNGLWHKSLPRVSPSRLPFRPLVALPLCVEVKSFPFSTLKVLELLLGLVVLFTVALLSTTCEKKNRVKHWHIGENWQRERTANLEWKHNNKKIRLVFLRASSFLNCQKAVSSIAWQEVRMHCRSLLASFHSTENNR